jgi:hypothetical protein
MFGNKRIPKDVKTALKTEGHCLVQIQGNYLSYITDSPYKASYKCYINKRIYQDKSQLILTDWLAEAIAVNQVRVEYIYTYI